MVAGTKRFVIFQTLLIYSLIIWIIWLIKIFQVRFSIIDFNFVIITGALLIFVQLILIGIKKNTTRDLKISEFKDITWGKVFITFFEAIILSTVITLVIKSINPTFTAIKKDYSSVIAQVIGGFVSGAVGFIAAMRVNYYQQKDRQEKRIKELVENLYSEITHNMIIVGGDLKLKFPFGRRLGTSCWDATVSAKLFINGRVKGLLGDLYADFDLYNFAHQAKRELALRETVSQILKERFNPVKDSLADSLYEDNKKANAILFGEMVRLGYRQRGNWSYAEIEWEKTYDKFINANDKPSGT